MKWKAASWLAVDVETTGLDPRKDRIVSIGIARKRAMGDPTIKTREWIINPVIPIPEAASEIHGITNDTVRGAPFIADVAAVVLAIVEKTDVLVGYNWPFDDLFLLAGFGDGWEDATEGTCVLDPLVVVRFDDVGRYWKGAGRHKLENVARRYQLQLPAGLRAHQASADAYLTLKLLDELRGELPDDAAEAARIVRDERVRQDASFQKWLAKKKAEEAEYAPDQDPNNGTETAGNPPHHY